jgi:hypothetical protein
MQKLRALHLYLGCIFAPMLLFFTVSGIWQTFGLSSKGSNFLSLLSTIHTSRGLKSKMGEAPDLTSPLMRYFVLTMSQAFIVTTVLGIVMAFKMGRNRRAAIYSLAAGVIIPLGLVVVRLFR